MFVRVSGNEFATVIERIAPSNETVYFKVMNNMLYLQAHGVLIYDARIPILDCDAEGASLSYSAVLDKALSLLNKKEDITITVNGEILFIEQESFSYTADKSYEDRVDTRSFELNYDIGYSKEQLRGLVASCRALDTVVRTLGVAFGPVSIKDGYAYPTSSSTAMVVPSDLPNMKISKEILSKINSAVSAGKFNLCTIDGSTIYFKINENEVVSTSIGEPSDEAVESITTLVQECKGVTSIALSRYNEEIQKIVSIYPKTLTNFGITENGISIYVDNINTKITYGDTGRIILGIKISTAQLSVIQRMFGECTGVEVLKGVNVLCLQQKNLDKKLMIAGLVY